MLFLGVDGTGPSDDEQYKAEMERSFIARLYDLYARLGAGRFYHRGPNLLAMGHRFSGPGSTPSQTHDLALVAKDWLLGRLAAGTRPPIVLAGYSRGGSACIETARLLQACAPSTSIDVLLLFDAVQRDFGVETAVIPGNVKKCFHAVRHDGVGSRSYFGHTGRIPSFPNQIEEKTIWGTHAALGGSSWTGDHPLRPVIDERCHWRRDRDNICPPTWIPTITKFQDRMAEAETFQFMMDALRRSGVQP